MAAPNLAGCSADVHGDIRKARHVWEAAAADSDQGPASDGASRGGHLGQADKGTNQSLPYNLSYLSGTMPHLST